MKTETRYVEVRAHDGEERVITGTLAPYGADANIGGRFIERINAGALRWKDVTLNVQHDRGRLIARTGAGLTLRSTDRALELRAELPATRIAIDALEAVRAGLLRGLSVEMDVQEDRWSHGLNTPVRVIERAQIFGAALVDRPAYPDAEIAARALERYRPVERGPWF